MPLFDFTLPGGLHVGRAPPEVLLMDVDRPLIGRPSDPGFPISEVVSFCAVILAPLAMVPDWGLVSLKACRSFLLTVGITFSLAAEAACALLAPNWLFFFPDSGEWWLSSDGLFGAIFEIPLAECGSPVAAFFISGLLAGRIGRTGADDRVPIELAKAVAGLAVPDEAEKCCKGAADWADPGRSGRFFDAIFARFWAAMVSRIVGFGIDVVLRDRGCAFESVDAAEASGALLLIGLAGSFKMDF